MCDIVCCWFLFCFGVFFEFFVFVLVLVFSLGNSLTEAKENLPLGRGPVKESVLSQITRRG